MMKELWKSLADGKEVRRTLIQIKEQLRGEKAVLQRDTLISLCGGDYSVLTDLLCAEDAKVRKNAALVIGELRVPKLMEAVWEAYRREETRFVRGAYLTALKSFDYTGLLPELKSSLDELAKQPVNDENRRHLQEEKLLLRELLGTKETAKPHVYRGEGLLSVIALTTNRNHKHAVLERLGNLKKKEFNAGVMVQTRFPAALFEIRCFEEMFFVLPKVRQVSAEPAEAAKMLAAGGIAEYLAERHEENGRPFFFRIEVRGSMPLEKRGLFLQRLAAALEERTGGRLANAVSGYEAELRLVESSGGGYNVLLKLFTLGDFRFAYRQQAVSSGMRPSNAALCMALAGGEGFFTPEASVLDPFCGAGTMLIERAKYGKVKEMFGLDILGEAVEAARSNTMLAGCRANYVRRDFFTFTREQGFDEVVTDMPFTVSGQPDKQRELDLLYRRFFERIPGLLRDNGRLLLYTHDRAFVRACAAPAFRILREFEISMKEKSYLILLVKI